MRTVGDYVRHYQLQGIAHAAGRQVVRRDDDVPGARTERRIHGGKSVNALGEQMIAGTM